MKSNSGQRARLSRPLDFLVVSDHAEYLGLADLLNKADPELLATEVGKSWYDRMKKGGREGEPGGSGSVSQHRQARGAL